MNENIKGKQIFHSMMEFEKEYFPKSFKKKIEEKPSDARALGISLAKESLDKIKNLLTR
ncbi:MAG: hypothetical protein MRJ65_08695 [Candidatus Brocadiaceae bacterium]|nr:hypothetical protein [Candidatus Brocadiaceae bacterium]